MRLCAALWRGMAGSRDTAAWQDRGMAGLRVRKEHTPISQFARSTRVCSRAARVACAHLAV